MIHPSRSHSQYLEFVQTTRHALDVKVPHDETLLWCKFRRPDGRSQAKRSVAKRPPIGLEMSRPASPRLVSRQSQRPGWPGRLHRVVRRPVLDGGQRGSTRRRDWASVI